MIASNAQAILSARLRGLKPDEMVMVSLVGRIKSANITVFADPDVAYDWKWAHGLDVCVWIGDEPNWAPTVKAIALCRPDYLCIWHQGQQWGARVWLFPTADEIDKPPRMWQWQVDFSEWMAFQNRDFAEGRR